MASPPVSPTTYLITGATRGIGLAIVELLSARPSARVIAGVRDVDAASAKSLASKSNVSVVKIDASLDDTPVEAVQQLRASGIEAIDVVIANAGVMDVKASIMDVAIDDLRRTLDINALAPLLLFRATVPLLQHSRHPRFFVTSSEAGLFSFVDRNYQMYEAGPPPTPVLTPYCASKTTVNMLAKRIALEHPWCTVVPFHPGVVATDMLIEGLGKDKVEDAVKAGAIMTTEQSAEKIVELIDTAQLRSHSGRFYDVPAGGFREF